MVVGRRAAMRGASGIGIDRIETAERRPRVTEIEEKVGWRRGSRKDCRRGAAGRSVT